MNPLMDEQLKQVLLVDDDPGLLFPLSKDLSMNQDMYRLVLAENGHEALEILAKENISLVVSDVNMPGINGFDLLAAVREQYPQIGVILMTAYGTDKMRRLVDDCGCLHFLEKPFRFDKLKELIKKQIAEKEVGFNGTLKNILLTDLIQICCIAGADMAIKVSNGPSEGVFYIEAGEVIHAECGDLQGESAFFTIVGWESGSFESFGVERFPEPTISKPYMYLLMEGSRQSDESGMTEENSDEGMEVVEEPENPHSTEPIGLTEEISPFGMDDLEASLDDALPDIDKVESSLDESSTEKIFRVMIVDDSAIMCRILSDTLSESERIEIVGTAKNGREALKKIEELKPDLITLDVNMPVMGGQTALKHIMIKNRCPVVIISSLNSGSYQNILDFLLLGAVDFIGKPVNSEDVAGQKRRIIEKIINAGNAHTDNFIRYKPPVAVKPELKMEVTGPGRRVVLILSGAGGYSELVRLLSKIPSGIRACLVVVHDMTLSFIQPLVTYLQERSRLNVTLLSPDQKLLNEHCYIGTPDSRFWLKYMDHAFVTTPPDSDNEIHPVAGIGLLDHDDGQLMTVMLSGALVGDEESLEVFKKINRRIIVKDPESCMVPDTLEKIIRSGVPVETAGLDGIAEQIAGFYKQTV
jgi:two-component system chemotaxis response regulator CheB